MFDILKRVCILFVCCVCVGGVGFAIDPDDLDDADWKLHEGLNAYQVSMLAQETIIYFGIQAVSETNMKEGIFDYELQKSILSLMGERLGGESASDYRAATERVKMACEYFEKIKNVRELYSLLLDEIAPLYKDEQIVDFLKYENQIVYHISQNIFYDWCNGDARRLQWIRKDMQKWQIFGNDSEHRFFEREELTKPVILKEYYMLIADELYGPDE